MEQAPPIGIDLGTTYSCVSVLQYGVVEIIPDEHGNRTMPSIVAFTDRERLIGKAAKDQLTSNLENTISCVKRLIGRKFNEKDVQDDIANLHYLVQNDEKGKPIIEVDYRGETRNFTPEEISSMILGKLKEAAETFLEMKVTDAVITVPANFNDLQRQATMDAGTIAGLNVLRIINEPTAAAMAFGHNKRTQNEHKVLIYDLGGGTLDVSILEMDDGIFKVISTAGDRNLGGFDFDNRLATYFAQKFKQKYSIDLSENKEAMAILRKHCEVAKCDLATKTMTKISINQLSDGIKFEQDITRAQFDDLCMDLFELTLKPVEKAMKDAQLKKNEIDEIILVGGSTRIHKIQKILSDHFNGKELNRSINPDEAVSYGAAVQGAIMKGDDEGVQDMVLLDVTPLSLGTEVYTGDFSIIIKRNTPIPVGDTSRPYTTVHDYQTSILFKIYEGERVMACENNLLGKFVLNDIPPAPKGVPSIKVTFKLDENGILYASAMDKKTLNKKEIVIRKGQLSEEEIARMMKEAQQFREFDEMARDRNKACFNLKEYINKVKFTLIHLADRIQEKKQKQIKNELEKVSGWFDENENTADKNEFEDKERQLFVICNPIFSNFV